MAKTKTIILKVDTKSAQEGVEDLNDSLQDVNKEIKDVGDAADKELGNLGSEAKKGSKGVGTMSTAFKGLGTAMKAAGIGLIIAAFAALGSVLSENQVVVDKVKTAWEFISIVLTDFVNFIIDNAMPAFEGIKTFFSNLTFKSAGDAIKKNLIERFNSLLDVFGFVFDALKKLKDGDFEGAWDSIKQAGKESIDVFTGVNNTFDKTVEIVNKVVDGVSSYGEEVLKTAQNIIKLNKESAIAVAIQSQLVEIYDRQAEQQRQIRDDESVSIIKRIEANDKLLEVLDKQEKSMLAQAEAQIKAAQAQFDKNGNDENQIALIDAQTNKLGVLAQIEGFRSEQKVNEIALDKELLELSSSKSESDAQLAIDAKRFAAERILDADERIAKLREVLDAEIEIERERLQLIIDSTNEGTQARVDATIALNERLQDLEQQRLSFNTVKTGEEIQLKKDVVNASFQAFDALVAIFGQETALGKAVLIAKQLAAAAEIAIGISKIQFKATETVAIAALDGATATTSVATGAAVTLASGFPAAIPLLIGYAAAAVGIVGGIISAIKTTKNVASQYGASGGGSSVTPKTPQVASIVAPSFNVVGTSGENQLAQTIAGQNDKPIKAFVVSSDITTQQSLDRNTENTATFG